MLDLGFLHEAEVHPAGDAERVEPKITRHIACSNEIRPVLYEHKFCARDLSGKQGFSEREAGLL
jgi:hypothetical protein